MTQDRLLLCAVFGPYGVQDAYGEELGCQMELLDNQVLGQPSLKDRARSLTLVATGALEAARLSWHQARGHESIPRQPPSQRVTYPLDLSLKAREPTRQIDHRATGWVIERLELPKPDLGLDISELAATGDHPILEQRHAY